MSTPNHAVPPAHDAIACEAHNIFLARNGAPGDPVKDWLDAEAALRARMSVTVTAIPPPILKPSPAGAPKPIANTPPKAAAASAAAGSAKSGGNKPGKKNRR